MSSDNDAQLENATLQRLQIKTKRTLSHPYNGRPLRLIELPTACLYSAKKSSCIFKDIALNMGKFKILCCGPGQKPLRPFTMARCCCHGVVRNDGKI
jgi:hypothetical protein